MKQKKKLSAKASRLLAWLDRVGKDGLLESQITASGMSSALNELLAAGMADMAPHPTVRERGVPVAVVRRLGGGDGG